MCLQSCGAELGSMSLCLLSVHGDSKGRLEEPPFCPQGQQCLLTLSKGEETRVPSL